MDGQELGTYCDMADTTSFLNHYFDVPSIDIDIVYNAMVAANYYHPHEKRWKYYDRCNDQWLDLPSSKSEKALFCSHLGTICQAIRRAYAKNDSELGCTWFNKRFEITSESFDTDADASFARPDYFLLLGTEAEAEKWETELEKLQHDPPILLKAVTAWWLRINVVFEVILKDADVLNPLARLMRYLQRILQEQLDRWFVPGLLISSTQLAVWVADRSGALGMQKSFNFHEEPKKFIQVILGCSSLSPERLGWNITMTVWRPNNDCVHRSLHSFCKDLSSNVCYEDAYARQWVIEMPSRGSDGNETRELFLTTKILNSYKPDYIEGRATVVWAARKLHDLDDQASYTTFVLKQCWRPISLDPEGSLYPPIDEAKEHHIGRVYSFEDVLVNEKIVNTSEFIRGNLEYSSSGSSVELSAIEQQDLYYFDSTPTPRGHISVDSDSGCLFFQFKRKTVTARVLARTLLIDSHGWPLHHFSDLLELVRVCLHTVGSLEFLYFQRRTLQSDISISNVLISSINGAEGCLIDFDYAKVVKEKKPIIIRQAGEWALEEAKKFLPEMFNKIWGKELPQRAAHVLSFYDDSFAYLRGLKTIKTSQLSDKTKLSEEDIGFLSDEKIQIPDLGKHTRENEKQSATLPFASPEVLKAKRIFPYPLPHPEDNPGNNLKVPKKNLTAAPHDARHDLEALFWCMTYICLTRGGPGGKRREELRSEFKIEDNEDVMQLRHINYCFFSSDKDTLLHNKTQLFERDDYDEAIVCHFHPYFKLLKPLMRQWWNILRFAHQYPMFETIHKTLRQVLASTLEALSKQPLSREDRKKTDKVLAERRKELEELWYPSFPSPMMRTPKE